MDEMFKGKWNELKGKIKEKWGKLTDNDLKEIQGRREVFLAKLQSRYGWEEHKAHEELKKFEKSCGCACSSCRGEQKHIHKDEEWEDESEGWEGKGKGRKIG